MQEERMRILHMVAEGKLTPEQAEKLLEALEKKKTVEPEPAATGSHARWFKVRVIDKETGKPRVNVRLPLSLVKVGTRFGAGWIPGLGDVELDEILNSFREGEEGKVIEVMDEESAEHVVISIE